MKIALIAPEMLPAPPVKGGAVETWIYEIAKQLTDNEVYIFSIYDPLIEKYKYTGKINILTYKRGLVAKVLLWRWRPFRYASSILYYLPYSLWCALQARKVRADIIHMHSRPQFIPIIRFFNSQAKIILHIHNVSVIDEDVKPWKKSLFDKANLIVTCSDYLKNEALRRYPYLKYKVKVIYNGVDMNQFNTLQMNPDSLKKIKEHYNINNRDGVVLFIGRLVEYKGAHLLIEAFKDLVITNSDTKLLIVGGEAYSSDRETGYIKRLKELAAGFEDEVIFTGYVDHKDIPDFIALSDIVVVPSVWEEPFGVVVIEAMAMAKCIIAFKKGGIKEIVLNDENGVLVEEVSAKALSTAIQRLLVSAQERKRLGQNARGYIQEKFSWPKIKEDVLAIYIALTRTSGRKDSGYV